MSSRKNAHLTIDDRISIEAGIRQGISKSAIARNIGKHPSTVAKEIIRHRTVTHRFTLPRECAAYRRCRLGRDCRDDCPDFEPFICLRRDRSPGACNGCSKYAHCRFTKYRYSASDAQHEYRTDLVEMRQGVNLTSDEAYKMAGIIGPLLKKGLSPYAILQIHPELGVSEKTIYNYVEDGVFEFAGIDCTSLRRQASRRMTKKRRQTYKKRTDRKYLIGRTYELFQQFLKEHPMASVVQMDTVYNDVTNGPFIQTFKFIDFGLFMAIYHDEKTAAAMVDGLNMLEEIIGRDLFSKYATVIITDRGTEFSDADNLEKRPDGSYRCPVFYCDPMQSGQKGSLENNHIELRYIFPKEETDLRKIGLTGQEGLRIAVNNINSYVLEGKFGKTPFELVKFNAPDLYEALRKKGYHQLNKDEIDLTKNCIINYKKNHHKI